MNAIRISTLALVAGLALSSPSLAVAQGPGGPPNPRRQALERELRMRTGEIVKRRLQLTDDQMSRLQATNRQFEQQRIALFARERDVRRDLRQQILAGDSANQSRVSQLLDQTFLLERQRLELMQTEQRELAKFLTPVQRAKLIGHQDELRRRTQGMARGHPGRPIRTMPSNPNRPDRDI